MVSQTDSTSIFPQRLKQKKGQNRMSGSSRARALPAPWCYEEAKPVGLLESRNKCREHARPATAARTEQKLLRRWRMNGNVFVYQLCTVNDCYCNKVCTVFV